MWTKQFHSVGHITQSILSHFQWPGKHKDCVEKKKLEEEKKKEREKKTCQFSCRQIVPSLSTWIWNLFPWRKWLSGKWRHGVLSCYCSIWEVLRNNNDNEFEKQHLCCCYNKMVINERQKSQTEESNGIMPLIGELLSCRTPLVETLLYCTVFLCGILYDTMRCYSSYTKSIRINFRIIRQWLQFNTATTK